MKVEHPVTEQVTPGLDIVELMILQGIAQYEGKDSSLLSHPFYDQALYEAPPKYHSIEARLYCENPAVQFKPCPGVLQQVTFPNVDWLRVESWVESGTVITPYFDPLACKLVVTGSTRSEAITRLTSVLKEVNMYGPPNNVEYLRAICSSETFQSGNATTTFLDTFAFVPR